MAISEARKRANKKWNDANMTAKYDRISVLVPKGRKQTIEARAKEIDMSVNGLINSLLQKDVGMSDDEWKAPAEE